jgi:hypothetical protein
MHSLFFLAECGPAKAAWFFWWRSFVPLPDYVTIFAEKAAENDCMELICAIVLTGNCLCIAK